MGAGASNRSMHGIVLRVATQDVGKPLLHCDSLARRSDRHIDEGQDIQLLSVGLGELGELDHQPPFLGFEAGTRMVRNQGHDSFGDSLAAEPVSPVNRVESRVPEGHGVAHVVQPRRADNRLGNP